MLLCHVRVRSSRWEVFCKKGLLRNFAKFTGKHLCHGLFFKIKALAHVFSCEFCKFSKNNFSYRTAPLAASGVSDCIYIYSFRTSCSKQTHYLKFKWTVTSRICSRSNIVQTSSICYVAGFQTPSMKMCSTKEV